MSLVPLRSVDTDHAPCYRKPPEYVIGRCDQALRVMALPFMLETAMGIELFADLRCRRKVILGAIECENRHTMPKERWIARPELISQIDGISENPTEDGPRDLATGMSECTAVDSFGIGPKAAAPCRLEEFSRLDIHAPAFTAGSQGKNESNQFGERQFPVTGEVRSVFFYFGINIFGDKIEKRFNGTGRLAWIFKA